MKKEIFIPSNDELVSNLKNVFKDVNEYSQEYINELRDSLETIKVYIDNFVKKETSGKEFTLQLIEPVHIYIYVVGELGNLKERLEAELNRVLRFSKQKVLIK